MNQTISLGVGQMAAAFLSLPIVTALFMSLLNYLLNKRKTDAETENHISETYQNLLKSCMSEIERLKLKIEELEKTGENEKSILLKKIEHLEVNEKKYIKRISELEKKVKEYEKRTI